MKLAKRRCPVCGKMFQPTRADQEYHSAACRQRAYRLREREARLRQRVWIGDAEGNVYIDGEYVGTLTAPPHVAWKGTGIVGDLPITKPLLRKGDEGRAEPTISATDAAALLQM